MKRNQALPLAAALFAALLGCGKQHPATGSAKVAVNYPHTLSQVGQVQSIVISVTGAQIGTPIVAGLTLTQGYWTGLVSGIPSGVADRDFHADAFGGPNPGDANLLYTGDARGVTINSGETAFVTLELTQVSPPPPFMGDPPLIDSIIASAQTVIPGGSIQLTVTAHDPADQPGAPVPLTYLWSSVVANSLDAPTATTTDWQAPAGVGLQTISVTVSDPTGLSTTQSIQILVASQTLTGTVEVGVLINTWPQVSQITATPTQVAWQTQTTVSVTASDVDGDPIAYAWTSDCPGTFSNTALASVGFTPGGGTDLTTQPPAACTVSVLVTDGRGGHTNATLQLSVGAPPAVVVFPDIDLTDQSAIAAYNGETIELRVVAHDPGGGDVSFQWSRSAGTLTDIAPPPQLRSSGVYWKTPTCSAAQDPTVTVTVTNSSGTVAHTFHVENCPSSCLQASQVYANAQDGNYWIDPDGYAGPAAPVLVYCDMTANGGGWQLVGAEGESSTKSTFDADQDLTSLVGPGPGLGLPPPASLVDAHFDLRRFDGYADHWTLRATVETNTPYGPAAAPPFQSTFWAPTSNDGTGLKPGTAGANWYGTNTYARIRWLATSTATSTPGPNTTWLGSADFGLDGALPTVNFYLFAFRDPGYEDLVTQCLDPSGQTRPCHSPPGGIVDAASTSPGVLTAAYGLNDGVAHSGGKRATYWLKNLNSSFLGGTP